MTRDRRSTPPPAFGQRRPGGLSGWHVAILLGLLVLVGLPRDPPPAPQPGAAVEHPCGPAIDPRVTALAAAHRRYASGW